MPSTPPPPPSPGKATEDELAEIRRLQTDPLYFIESCLFIVDKNSQKVPFIPNGPQVNYFLNRTNRDNILKARKMGFSTFILGLFVHAFLFRENTFAVIMSHTDEAAANLFERLRYMLENCLVKPRLGKDAGNAITNKDTNSKIWIGTAGSKSFGRGDDISHLHLSERAFYEKESAITGIEQALVNDAYVVIESTANGAGTPHHLTWQKAERGESEYRPHFFPWFKDPAYRVESPAFELDEYEKKLRNLFGLDYAQLAWRRKIIRGMTDPKLFAQEYPATPEEAFLTSGRMIFDWESIQHLEADARPAKWRGFLRNAGTESRIEPNKDGPLQIWKTPDDRVDYLITADSAEGIPGLDYSVADVWDTRTWEQVAQFRGYIEPDRFGDLLYDLGAMYRWAVIAGEINYPGNAVMARLARSEKTYPNLWTDPQGSRSEPGWRTTEKSKALIVTDAREAVRDLDIRINSQYTLAELKTFVVTETGKMEAQSGCHDDTVITMALAAYILKRWTLEPDMRRGSFNTFRGGRSRNKYARQDRPSSRNIV